MVLLKVKLRGRFFNLDPDFAKSIAYISDSTTNPEMMFHEEYAFFTRQSKFMQML